MQESVLILAHRYAKAALGLAVEAHAVDAVGEQLAVLAVACLPDRKAWGFWRSLKVPDDEKRHTLQDILEKMDAHTVVRNAANLLLDRGRFELLPDLVKLYHRQAQERSHVVEAVVTSAFELSDESLAAIRKGLVEMTGKTVLLRSEVDPQLIGGISVRVGNLVIDGSVRGRLNVLGRSFA